MQHISDQEREVIHNLHLGGLGIVVVAHAPQANGGCHPFEFLRGILPKEDIWEAKKRVTKDVLSHIASECGRSCACNNGKPVVYTRIFPK